MLNSILLHEVVKFLGSKISSIVRHENRWNTNIFECILQRINHSVRGKIRNDLTIDPRGKGIHKYKNETISVVSNIHMNSSHWTRDFIPRFQSGIWFAVSKSSTLLAVCNNVTNHCTHSRPPKEMTNFLPCSIDSQMLLVKKCYH